MKQIEIKTHKRKVMLLYNDYSKSKKTRHFSSDREIFLIYTTTNKRVSLG